MEQNQEGAMERQGSCLLLRCASQNSLDESSQKHISQNHPHSKERPPYRNHLHTQKAFDVMNVMRKQKLLCDVTLVADTVEIPAHKMVLAACSPYFYAMFSSFEESRQDRIVLQEVDHQALSLLVEYVYTSEVQVTEDNVQVLLPAANLLQLTDVRDACCDFLQAQLHPTNCLGIRAFADLHGCLELLSHAESYIELHFPEVVECEEFLTLSHQQVSKLICSDRLTVPSEEKVFECVIAWVHHDLENRHKHLAALMEHVRLPLMSQEYLVQRVEEEPLLKADLQCKDYLIEALKYHLLKGDTKTSFRTPRTKPRQPVGLPKVLLVVGGQAPKAIRSVESYDFKEERWFQVAEMPTRRCRAGLAVLGGKVYAVGGFNGSLRVKTVDVYDAALDVWTSCESMEARRSTLGVAVLNNCIYAVGGFDGSTGLNTAEMYDSQTGKWKEIAPMSTRRSSVGVGVLYGQLYAVGGYDGASRQCLSSVECYTPETDTWIPVPDMCSRRSGAGVGVLDGILYAVGGHDGPLVRKSVEAYDPAKNKWIPVSDMALCRRNAGVVAMSGLLYVVATIESASTFGVIENAGGAVQISTTARPELSISSTVTPLVSPLPQGNSQSSLNYALINNRQLGINPSLIPSANIIPPEIGPLPKGTIDLGTTVTVSSTPVPVSVSTQNIQRINDDVIGNNVVRSVDNSVTPTIPVQNHITGGVALRDNSPGIPPNGLIGSGLAKYGIDSSQINLAQVPLSSARRLAPNSPLPASLDEEIDDVSSTLWNRYGRDVNNDKDEKGEKGENDKIDEKKKN